MFLVLDRAAPASKNMNFYSVIVLLLCLGLGLVTGDTEVETSPLSQGNCPDGWVDGSFVEMGEKNITYLPALCRKFILHRMSLFQPY